MVREFSLPGKRYGTHICARLTFDKHKMKKSTDAPVRPGKLYRTALALAKKGDAVALERATGIPAKWTRKFRNEKIPDPSVNRIEKLIAFFSRA